MRRVSPAPDNLDEILRAINVRSTLLCRSEFTAPWGFRVEDSPLAKFHIVLDGNAWLDLEDPPESHRIDSGTFVLLPRGSEHVVRDDPGSPTRDLEAILTDHPLDAHGRLRYGGDGSPTTVLCGVFEADLLDDGMTDLLPRALILDKEANSRVLRWLQPIAELSGAGDANPGDSAVLTKVAEVFITDFLRHYLAQQSPVLVHLPSDKGRDAPIAAAVRLMRRDPRAAWTVNDLARRVGMSRTAFAARFRDVVGEPPISYLTRLRLSQGAGHLATTSRTIASIARDVGYDNESSFSKAFKRHYRRSPGAYRADWSA